MEPWPEGGGGRPVTMASQPIPEPDGAVPYDPGPDAAWARLTSWLERVDDYPDTRDLPAVDGTSDLSADLKFGTLAALVIFAEARLDLVVLDEVLAERGPWLYTGSEIFNGRFQAEVDGIFVASRRRCHAETGDEYKTGAALAPL